MKINPYLNFDGQCEDAFKFYAHVFGGQVGDVFRYGGSPMADQVGPDWQHKIMHGSVTIAGLVLMGADIAQGYQEMKGVSLSIQIADTAEAERIFGELSQGGMVTMPLEQTFWAKRFGMVVDRFGIPWLVNCE